MIENDSYVEYINGPIEYDVILHINNYKNIDINDLKIGYDLINKDNVVSKLEIKLNDSYYQFSGDLYCNENRTCQDEFEEKRYTFEEPERFDKFLKEKNFLPKMDGVFSSEIILNLIQMVYANFKEIYINNKIEGIIRSLSQEELVILKEKLQEQDIKLSQRLVRIKNDTQHC